MEALVIRVVTANCAAMIEIVAKNAKHPNNVFFFRESLEEKCRYYYLFLTSQMLRDLQPFCSPRSTDIHNRNNINHKPPFLVSQAADESHESEYRNKQRADSHVKTSAKN